MKQIESMANCVSSVNYRNRNVVNFLNLEFGLKRKKPAPNDDDKSIKNDITHLYESVFGFRQFAVRFHYWQQIDSLNFKVFISQLDIERLNLQRF